VIVYASGIGPVARLGRSLGVLPFGREVRMVDPLVVRLRERRMERGLSQRAMAGLMRVGHGHLSRIETGVVDPKLSTIRRMAELLGVAL
jgi:DNA-binding XRE family transcriptional regulator